MTEKILSQDEIDALLRGVQDGAVTTGPERPEGPGAIAYDLANQDRILRGRMPTLEMINDVFSRLFRGTLSLAIRKTVEASPGGVQLMKFGEFLKSLPFPTSLNIFRMEPLRGHGLLVLDSKLIFMMVDIFLGGSGKSSFAVEGREFTAIESKLIYRLANLVYTDLEKAWSSVHRLTVRHGRSEINPQFANIVPAGDLVVNIHFKLEMENFGGGLTVCLPYAMLEPIKVKLSSGYQTDIIEVDRSWMDKIWERLQDAEVEIKVELGRGQILIQDLLNLKVGDMVPLGKKISEPLIGKVENIPKFQGKAGVYGQNKAFQIETKIMSA